MVGHLRGYRTMLLVFAFSLALASCGSDTKNDSAGTGDGSAANTSAGSSTDGSTTGSGEGGTGATVTGDVCALLTAEEASAIMGTRVKAEKGSETDCTYMPDMDAGGDGVERHVPRCHRGIGRL